MLLLAAFALASQEVIRPSIHLTHAGGTSAPASILPPYKRVQTLAFGDYSTAPSFVGNAAIRIHQGFCEKIDLATFKTVWRCPVGKKANEGEALLAGGILYVTTDPAWRQTASNLFALDAATGKLKWSISRQGPSSAMAVSGDTLFVSLSPYQVSALNLRTHRPKWTTRIGQQDPNDFPAGKLAAVFDPQAKGLGAAVITVDGNFLYVLNAQTGQTLWKKTQAYVYMHPPVVYRDSIWIPTGGGSEARDLKTGNLLWQSNAAGSSDFATVWNGRFVALNNADLIWIDPNSGKLLNGPSLKPGHFSGGNQFGQRLGGLLFVRNDIETAAIDLSGKLLWKQPSGDSISRPVWSDGKSLVCFDGNRLLRYVQGSETATPTTSAGREALAAQMVAKFQELDPNDVKRLQSLGDDAFEPILKQFLAACATYDKHQNDMSQSAYNEYHDLAKVLEGVTTAKHADEIMATVGKTSPKSSASPFLLTLLAKVGDPHKVVPYFLKALQAPTPGFEMYESSTFVARQYIETSKDPAAIAFMMAQLKDPKADPTLRESGYDTLAGTAGVEGVKAVLSMQRKRSLLPSIEERMDLEHVGTAKDRRALTTALSQKTAKDGRVWGLLQCGVLGSSGDLWIAEKVNGHWVHPRFLDVSTDGVSKWAKGFPERTFAGKTAKQLADGAWFDACVGNPTLDKDSGGSGLTDLEKKRLGLPIGTKDVDGDGDPDSIDPWPNAPVRQDLSDAEKVLSAAFEARYHFYQDNGPAILFAPPDMKPFEMVGWAGPVIWQSTAAGKGDFDTDLSACYEQGVAFLRFTPRSRDENGKWEDTLISWSPGRTQATVGLSTYFGGLSGDGYEITVTKFGKNWVVTSMRMAYVS